MCCSMTLTPYFGFSHVAWQTWPLPMYMLKTSVRFVVSINTMHRDQQNPEIWYMGLLILIILYAVPSRCYFCRNQNQSKALLLHTFTSFVFFVWTWLILWSRTGATCPLKCVTAVFVLSLNLVLVWREKGFWQIVSIRAHGRGSAAVAPNINTCSFPMDELHLNSAVTEAW